MGFYKDANVYLLEASNVEVVEIEGFKRRLVDQVWEKSGWDIPMLMSLIMVEVESTWNAIMDTKRKKLDNDTASTSEIQEPDRMKERRKEKKVIFEEKEMFESKP